MEALHHFRDGRVQQHVNTHQASYVQPTEVASRAYLAPNVESSMHRINRNYAGDVHRFQVSVSAGCNVVEPRQFASRTPAAYTDATPYPRRPGMGSPERYVPKPVTFGHGSAFTDPDLRWSRQLQATALRDMHRQTVMSPTGSMKVGQAAVPTQPWPINLPPQVMQPSRPGPCIGNPIPELQVKNRNPYPNTFATPVVEDRVPCNRLCSSGGSAFSRPPTHAVPPTTYSSLDMEIFRLRGMITRVEMLREKYKYQAGTLHYPRALPDVHSGVKGGSISVPPNAYPAWYAEQQGQQSTASRVESMPNHINTGYPCIREQLLSPKCRLKRDTKKQRMSQRAKCLSPNGQLGLWKGRPTEGGDNGMPRIVDVRSLAQGSATSVDTDKLHRSPSDGTQQRVSSNARSGVRLSTESRNETRSVESLDSGVESMSSPTDAPSQRGPGFGHGKVKQMEDIGVNKEELYNRHEPYQSHCQASHAHMGRPTSISPGSLHSDCQVVITSSPPPRVTEGNRKRLLLNAITETPVKRPRTGTQCLDVTTTIPGTLRQPTTSKVDSDDSNDRVLDLSLKKRYTQEIRGRKEPHQFESMQVSSRNHQVEMDPGIQHSQPWHPGATMPSSERTFHNNNDEAPASVEDLVALSVHLARQIPREKSCRGSVAEKTSNDQRSTRGLFITKLIQKAEDMLQGRPRSAAGNQESSSTWTQCRPDYVSRKCVTPINDPVPQSRSQKETTCTRDKPEYQSTRGSTHSDSKSIGGNNNKDSDNQKNTNKNTSTTDNDNKNSCYIEIMVNEALRAIKGRPKEEGMIEKPERSLTTSQGETDSNSAPSDTADPKRDQPCRLLEALQGMPKSPPAPQPPASSESSMKFPDVRVLLRPLKYDAPKPVSQGALRSDPDWRKQPENVFEAAVTKRQDQDIKLVDATKSAPNFLVPTEDGFRRMHVVEGKPHEVYRVTSRRMQTASTQSPAALTYSVSYKTVTFPCVLRSDVPFVPTQLLVQDMFPGRTVATVCKALQRCNILNRYMIRHEQEALQGQLRMRGITSCKLIPLDELYNKWEQIVEFIQSPDNAETPSVNHA